MWKGFEFNKPYDGVIPDIINGVELPIEYIEFMRRHNGCYGDTGESYLILFPIEELEESNDDYNVSEYLEGCFIIGNNGAGELYGINKEGKYFIVPDIIEEEYLTVIGDSIESLPEDINNFWKNLR